MTTTDHVPPGDRTYEADHAMRVPAARDDRRAFLARALGW